MAWPCGYLLVDKPSGATSRDVVERIQRVLAPAERRRRGEPRFRCGHAGTLDPLATGLLIVLVGRGTRLSQFLLGHDKTYTATFRFGVATDTLDAAGQVTAEAHARFTEQELKAALLMQTGDIDQVPPLISALKRNGRPLYRRVRDGEDVAPASPRRLTVHEFRRLGSLGEPDQEGRRDCSFHLRCSSGTYVRACARDLAMALDTEAHVTSLRRESIGPFTVQEALSAAEIDNREILLSAIRPLASALPGLPTLALDAAEAAGLRLGHQPAAEWRRRLSGTPRGVAANREPLWLALDAGDELVAVGRLAADPERPELELLRIAAVFAPPGEA